MFPNENKIGLYSILIGLLGLTYLIWLSNLIEIDLARIVNERPYELVEFQFSEYSSFKYRLIAIGIGITGIYFGRRALLPKKIFGIIGILISLGVIIISFYPFFRLLKI